MSRANWPITAIPYFGGKMPHLPFLYANFVENVHLVDCMCGGASVAINAPKSKYPLITINDINSDVINFFYVLRNHLEELVAQLMFTPFAREEFYLASEPCEEPVERARRYFVRSLQGYSGQGSQNIDKHSWGYELAIIHKYNGHPRKHYRVTTWQSKADYLHEVAAKLRDMQIEHRPWQEMFDIYGVKNSLLYLDPPYVMGTRSDKKRYRHEFDNDDHIELCTRAKDATCHVAISGYDNEIYNDLLRQFYKVTGESKKTNTSKKAQNEVLWLNYEPPKKQHFITF